MPLHRNESTTQKTLSLKSGGIFVKENFQEKELLASHNFAATRKLN